MTDTTPTQRQYKCETCGHSEGRHNSLGYCRSCMADGLPSPRRRRWSSACSLSVLEMQGRNWREIDADWQKACDEAAS